MKSKKLIWGAVFLVAMLLVPGRSQAQASSAIMYLSPASSSVVKGAVLTVDIHENSGQDEVNAVKAYLTYPTDKLEPINIIPSSSFNLELEGTYGGGTVKITRAVYPPQTVSGDQIVASVVFKVVSSEGIAAVNFTNESAVYKADGTGTNILTSTTGGNYTLISPSSPSAPAAVSQSPETLPALLQDKLRPKISDVTASDIAYDSVTMSWKTSEPATTEVHYGVNEGYGLSHGDRKFVTEHKVVLKSPFLMPGKTYHFMVKSVDPAGNAASSNDGTFATKGYKLVATVVDQKGKHLPSARVTIAEKTDLTDRNGQAVLGELPIGQQTALVEYRGSQTVVNTEVKPATNGEAEPVTLKIETKQSNPWLLLLLTVLTAAALLFSYHKRGGQVHRRIGSKVRNLKKSRK